MVFGIIPECRSASLRNKRSASPESPVLRSPLIPTDHILALLVSERDKVNRAIEALGGTTGKRRGRPPGSKNKAALADSASESSASAPRKRTLSAAGRKAIADAARKRWAAIRAGKAKSPFAKSGKR